MQLLHVINCGEYRTWQRCRQVIPCRWINLSISGLKRHSLFHPDGTPDASTYGSGPYLSLGYPEFVTTFEYRHDRENWVLMMEYPEFRYDPKLHQLYLQQDDERIFLRHFLPLQELEIPELREQFARIAKLSAGALTADRIKADLCAAGIFLRFLSDEKSSASCAEALRERLDNDRGHRFSVKEHCEFLNQNPDSLRREFTARFGITPGVYRERKRKNDLLSLFAYSDLSFKEIALQLGLKHVQHLNLLTGKYFHCTPGTLNRQFRENRNSDTAAKTANPNPE